MNLKAVLLLCAVLHLHVSIAPAQERIKHTPKNNTPEEIFIYLEKAVQLVLQKGEAAFEELTDPEGSWVKDEWYIFINDFDGYNVAHINKKIIGKNFFPIRDIKGNAFFAEMQKIAMSEKGRGWVEFWYPKPNKNKPSRKIGFVMRIPGKRLWIGTGAYDIAPQDLQKGSMSPSPD